jgi:hypothetical protein
MILCIARAATRRPASSDKNNSLPLLELPEIFFVFATGQNDRLDLEVKQGVECSATNPKNEKKYAFHVLLLDLCAEDFRRPGSLLPRQIRHLHQETLSACAMGMKCHQHFHRLDDWRTTMPAPRPHSVFFNPPLRADHSSGK